MTCASIPAAVMHCCSQLRKAGHLAYPVGGCVRDRLLGRIPGDWDVTTSAKPEQVQALFSHTVPTGIRHGTVTVIEDDIHIEVTTFRRENGYRDSRHPDSVSFDTDLAGDLARRDFTVNAMALGEDGEIIDPYGGQADLKQKLIRAVGVAKQRFSEDALRILRGVRFAAQLGFQVEEGTMTAMEKCASLVEHVSPERIKAEMEKILISPNPQRVQTLVKLGVLNRFYNGWPDCEWEKLLESDHTPMGRWAAFCALTGFPITALPVERAVRMAVLHPEREYVKKLSLTATEIQGMGLTGERIGTAQRMLAEHIRSHPEENRPEILKILLNNMESREDF